MKFHKNYIILFLIFLFVANSLILIKRNNLNFSFLNFFDKEIEHTLPTTREYSRLSPAAKNKVLTIISIIINRKRDKKIFYELSNLTPVEKAIIVFMIYPQEIGHDRYAGVGTKQIITSMTYEQYKNYNLQDKLTRNHPLLVENTCTYKEAHPENLNNLNYLYFFRENPNNSIYFKYICK